MTYDHFKKLLIALLLVNIFVLVLTAAAFYRDKTPLSVAQESLILERDGADTLQSFYVDNSYDGQHRSITTPKLILPMGVFDVTVSFSTSNAAGSGVTGVQSYAESETRYPWVRSGRVRLLSYMDGSASYRIYVSRPGCETRIRNVIDDHYDVWLAVNGITVTYLKGTSTARFLLLAAFFLLLIEVPVVLHFLPEGKVRSFVARCRVPALTVAAMGLFATLPLLSDYIGFGYDLPFHLSRIRAIAEGLKSGYFPVKVHPGWLNGYGYATGIFYCDLFLYIPALLHLCGISILGVYRIYVIFMNILTAGIAYASFKGITKDRYIALMGSAVYTLSLFRLGCSFTWVQLGTCGAMAFFPLVILGVWRIYSLSVSRKEKDSAWICLCAGMAGVVFNHVLSSVILVLVLVLFALIMHKRTFTKPVLTSLGKAIIACALVCLWYVVPFLDSYMNNSLLHLTQYRPFSARAIQPPQVFSNVYSTVLDQPKFFEFSSMKNNSILTLGNMPAVILLIGILLSLSGRPMRYKKPLRMCTVGACLTAWMTTSVFPWNWLELFEPVVPVLDTLEYPWRFMPLCAFFITLVFVFSFAGLMADGGAALSFLKVKSAAGEKKENPAAGEGIVKSAGAEGIVKSAGSEGLPTVLVRSLYLLCAGVICLFVFVHSLQYMNTYTNEADEMSYSYEVDKETMRFVLGGEFLLENRPDVLDTQLHVYDTGKTMIAAGEGSPVQAEIVSRQGVRIDSIVDNKSGSDIYVSYPLMGYAGYQTKENLPVSTAEDGRVLVTVPAGYSGSVTVDFKEAWTWRASELISLLSLLIFAVMRVPACKDILSKRLKKPQPVK